MKNARSLLPAALAALFALALPAAARVLSQGEIETAAANFLAFDDLARELLPGRTVASGAVDDNLNHSLSFSVPPAGVSRLT